jgi:hypothetical protein
MNKQIFLKYLSQFEITLNQLDYSRIEWDDQPIATYKDTISCKYLSPIIKREIHINYILWDDGETSIGMSMYITHSKGTFFSLTDFLKNHKLEYKIKSRLSVGCDFEPFVKKYFEDLKVLFENELNDQITGKTFENHMDALRKSMDEY